MKVVVTIWDLFIFGIIALSILIAIISSIIKEIKKIGKKNCYKCKFYKLNNVASCGDGCWFICTKHNRKDDCVSMNESEHYERCNDYIEEVNKQNENN